MKNVKIHAKLDCYFCDKDQCIGVYRMQLGDLDHTQRIPILYSCVLTKWDVKT